MNPDKTLREIRELSRRILKGATVYCPEAAALAEHVDALDEWLQRGGSLPAAWR